MYAQEKRPTGQANTTHRPTVAPAARVNPVTAGPMNPAAMLALQRSIGNKAVSRRYDPEQEQHAHDAGCGHTPTEQLDLVTKALSSPSRPIDAPRRTKLESFHQANFSGVQLHTGLVAQRSAAAIGAKAYTVENHIVLGAGANNDETLGHEALHVKQQSKGKVAGTDNGAGLSFSDPGHKEERDASTDGAAFKAGHQHAPSLVAQRAVLEGEEAH